jgi:hypothetical protein
MVETAISGNAPLAVSPESIVASTPVEDGVGDVCHLRTGRQRVVAHRLQHLRGANAKLAGDVALGDHHLLGEGDLLGGDLHAEVAASDHDAVGVLEDIVEVAHALLVLNLGDDLDVFTAVFVEELSNHLDVVAALDEGHGDVVHLVHAGEFLDVFDVLLLEDVELDLDAGQVTVLALAEFLGVDDFALEVLLVDDLDNLDDDGSIGEEQAVAGLDALAQLGVGAANLRLLGGLVTLPLGVLVGAGGVDDDVLAGFELDGLVVLEHGGANLGTLGVEEDGAVRLLLLADLAEAIEDTLVRLVIAVREVEARHAHARVDQLPHGFLVPALGTHGADDLGLPHHRLVLHDHRGGDTGGPDGEGVLRHAARRRHDALGDVLRGPELGLVEVVGIDERQLRHGWP